MGQKVTTDLCSAVSSLTTDALVTVE